jgi:putative membrane protein
MADPAPTSNELAQQRTDMASVRTHQADERTDMAVDRTVLAHERTLMAWIRTATSLISFGFTIYKFFQGMHDAEKLPVVQRLFGPREFGITMISLGVGALILATLQNRAEMKGLAEKYKQYGPIPRSTATTVATVVCCFGFVALILVILHL